MTSLERRCRLLLYAYPPGYREDRGREIVDTLLEATPDGRNWPLPRDARSLVIGGVRTRAALNQQCTTAANLRIAVLAGVIASFALSIPGSLASAVYYEHALGTTQLFWQHVWPRDLLAPVLGAVGILTWAARSRLVVLAAVVAGAAFVLYSETRIPHSLGTAVTGLACLAALAVAGSWRARPSARWLWLLGIIVAISCLPQVQGLVWRALWLVLMLALCAISLAWLSIDARPAIAVAVCVLAVWLPVAIDNARFGFDLLVELPVLIICMLGAGAFWRLRRQSAPPGRRTG